MAPWRHYPSRREVARTARSGAWRRGTLRSAHAASDAVKRTELRACDASRAEAPSEAAAAELAGERLAARERFTQLGMRAEQDAMPAFHWQDALGKLLARRGSGAAAPQPLSEDGTPREHVRV